MGLALLLNSKVTRISIKTFGLYGHTSFCHVFQVIRALLLGFVPTPSMQWVNGFMGWVTVRVLTRCCIPVPLTPIRRTQV